MRILFVNFEYPPLGGGGGVLNALLAEELAKRHEVVVLTSRALSLPAEETQGGVRILRVPVFFRQHEAVSNLPSMFAWMVMGQLLGGRLVSRTLPQIINTHFVLPSGPVGDWLARRLGVPNIVSLHSGDLYDPSKWTSPHRHPLLRCWVRALLLRADEFVGQSNDTLERARRLYVPKRKGVRILLGIRRPPEGTASRAQYGCSDRDVLLITIGRLIPRKAVDHLIRVVARLRVTHVHLLVVGNGPLMGRLVGLARDLHVDRRVHFLGQVDEEEKFRLLRMSDVLCSASQHEGFGLTYLEAMVCGRPVIAYDHGGQRDFLEDGKTGYLVPLNDEAALDARCRELIENPQARRAIGATNLRRAEGLLIDSCARQYEALFAQVIAHHARRQLKGTGPSFLFEVV
jgi:L-malate glycosyltransferase